MKLVKAGVIPLFFMMDVFYSAWSLFKMIHKIYQTYKVNIYINKYINYYLKKYSLPDYIPENKIEESKEPKQDHPHENNPNQNSQENNNKICIICLNEIESGKLLACSHIFHLNCIK